jgi:mRNA-degrading endonuclease toxin of MazEF toxin-antitoxin module
MRGLSTRLTRLLRGVSSPSGPREDEVPRPAGRAVRSSRQPSASSSPSPSPAGYPGDFTGTPELVYSPKPDGRPDPGEIVWTWVPFEEDHLRGKDRPVLLIGRDAGWLLGLMLTSKDHDRDAAQEARHGRHWIDIGAGAWDRDGRPSEVRVDRIVRVDERRVRREGAVLDEERFQQVAAAVRSTPQR